MYCGSNWNFSTKMKLFFPEVAMQPFCLLILLFFIIVTPLNPWFFFLIFHYAFVLVLNFIFFIVYTSVSLGSLLLVLKCFHCAICCAKNFMGRYLKKNQPTSTGWKKWKNLVHFKLNRIETVKPTPGHSFRQAPEQSFKHQWLMKSWRVIEN